MTGLTNGRQHTVELRAVNASGEGAASSDKATPLWPAPNLVATPDHGRVHLEWTGVPGAKDYTLTTKGPGVNWSSFLTFGASPSKVDDSIGLDPNNPLTNGTEYTFTVWSTTAGGTQTSVKASVKATPVAPIVQIYCNHDDSDRARANSKIAQPVDLWTSRTLDLPTGSTGSGFDLCRNAL